MTNLPSSESGLSPDSMRIAEPVDKPRTSSLIPKEGIRAFTYLSIRPLTPAEIKGMSEAEVKRELDFWCKIPRGQIASYGLIESFYELLKKEALLRKRKAKKIKPTDIKPYGLYRFRKGFVFRELYADNPTPTKIK